MSAFRTLCLLGTLALAACEGEDEVVLSTPTDPTEDLSGGMPPVDTERPNTDADAPDTDVDTDTDVAG